MEIKIYLAAGFRRKKEMRNVRDYIERAGPFKVTSRWLESEASQGNEGTDQHLREVASMDLDDIRASDALILFADPESYRQTVTGGRHVESGYALAFGKFTVIVGRYENAFSRLFNRVDTIPEALTLIALNASGHKVAPGAEVHFASYENRPEIKEG